MLYVLLSIILAPTLFHCFILPVGRFPVLDKNKLCQNGNTCITEEVKRDTWTQWCFPDACSEGETVHCAEYTNKLFYYCSKPRMCDAGMRDEVLFNETSNEIILTNVECPTGFYQTRPRYCNDTCHNRHLATPSYVIVVLPGNSSHSALGVCNSSAGYFFDSQQNNVTVFEIAKFRDPCFHRQYWNTNCTATQDICANGTCTTPCASNLTRDPCDCACKPANMSTCLHYDIHNYHPPANNETKVLTKLSDGIFHVVTTGAYIQHKTKTHEIYYVSDNRAIIIAVSIGVFFIMVAAVVISIYTIRRGNRQQYIQVNKGTHISHSQGVTVNPSGQHPAVVVAEDAV